MMMRKISKRRMFLGKENTKNNAGAKKNRMLIIVNVLGSTGPLKLLVNEDDSVSTVIDSSLKLYARGGRLPVLGSDHNNFLLFPSNAPSALSSSEAIGLCGERNFVMSKKKNEARSDVISRHSYSHGWKSWLNSLNKSCKIIPH